MAEEEMKIEIVTDGNQEQSSGGEAPSIQVGNDESVSTETQETQSNENNESESNSIELGDESMEPSTQEQPSSSSALLGVIQALGSEGIIDYNEEELGNSENEAEYLRKALENELKRREFSDLNDNQKEFLDALRSGVNFEEFVNIKANQQSLEKYTDEQINDSETIQSALYKKELVLRGYSEEEAIEMVEDSKKIDKLKDRAIKSKSYLEAVERDKTRLAKEKAQQQQKEFEKNAEKARADLKKFVNTQEEVIPGVKINDKVRESVYKKMTEPVDQDKDGRPISFVHQLRSKDPMNFEFKLNYYAELGLFDEDADFSKIVSSLKTKQTKNLDSLLKSEDAFVKGTGRVADTPGKGLSKGFFDSIDSL